jgi:predicted transcriptional regulator
MIQKRKKNGQFDCGSKITHEIFQELLQYLRKGGKLKDFARMVEIPITTFYKYIERANKYRVQRDEIYLEFWYAKNARRKQKI